MPQSIPAGLTREHVLRAITDLDAEAPHPFGPPTKYELLHEGRRYAPKAVVGLACRYSLGRVLAPEEFSGGEAPGHPAMSSTRSGGSRITFGYGRRLLARCGWPGRGP